MSSLSKRLLPVIHCVDPFENGGTAHAVLNTRIALENGADGVFLIGHGLSHIAMLRIYEHVRESFPNAWIGINFLNLSGRNNWKDLEHATNRCNNLNALWIDGMPPKPLLIGPDVKVFGGVAFKYINSEQTGDELAAACEKAMYIAHVITTSGNATGSAPNIEKLEVIRKNIGDIIFRLALASGVTINNVRDFKPFVDDFLVASSIVTSRVDGSAYEDFVPEKVKELAEAIHE